LPLAVTQSPTAVLGLAVGLLLGLAVFNQLYGIATSLLGTYTGEKLVLDFRAKLFHHAQRLSVSHHDMRGSADSAYRIQYDAAAIQYVPMDGLIPFITAGFKLATMIYITLRLDASLALVALAISPALLLFHRLFDKVFATSTARRKSWRVRPWLWSKKLYRPSA